MQTVKDAEANLQRRAPPRLMERGPPPPPLAAAGGAPRLQLPAIGVSNGVRPRWVTRLELAG
jgi:hypothetical protein